MWLHCSNLGTYFCREKLSMCLFWPCGNFLHWSSCSSWMLWIIFAPHGIFLLNITFFTSMKPQYVYALLHRHVKEDGMEVIVFFEWRWCKGAHTLHGNIQTNKQTYIHPYIQTHSKQKKCRKPKQINNKYMLEKVKTKVKHVAKWWYVCDANSDVFWHHNQPMLLWHV